MTVFKPLEVLSAGVGVQTITLAQLSIEGHLPPLDCAIFADTGWEPAHVYTQLGHMADALAAVGVPTYIVNNGNIRDDALTDGRFASMPLHMKGDAGNGIARRQCTNEYKLTPIKRKVRELLGASKVVTPSGLATVGRVPGKPGTRFVNMWVGISTDEIERVKPSDVSYIRRSDPLIDVLNMSRDDCERYLAERWPHPVSRSSCIGCPYHDNKTWREMRDGDPVAFADAVDFDRSLRAGGLDAFKSEAYLHEQRVPLGEADLDRLSRSERRRMQGSLPFEIVPRHSCSPWGCRSEQSA